MRFAVADSSAMELCGTPTAEVTAAALLFKEWESQRVTTIAARRMSRSSGSSRRNNSDAA